MTDHFAVNGRICPADQATISVLDLGFLRGLGAFETFRTYCGGLPHALGEHLHRLWESSEAIGVAPFFKEQEVRDLLHHIHGFGSHDEMRVNLVVSPGPHTSGVFGADHPTWVMICRDLHAPEAAAYRDGVTAITFSATRSLPTLKTTNYLSGRNGLAKALQVGAHEGLYVDGDGHVTEGVTSNIIVRRGQELTSPTSGCLGGITRAGLKPICQALGLDWIDGPLTVPEVLAADEVWITSAVRELLPVVRVDGCRIGTGTPGPWARRLGPLYRQSCLEQSYADAHRRS